MTYQLRAAALFLAVFAFATPVTAADCNKLTLLTSIDTIPTDAGGMLVPVKLNGVEKHMLLDTASGFSSLTQKEVDALNLQRQDTNWRMLDSSGYASRNYVRVKSVQLGRLTGNEINFMVQPNPNATNDGYLAGDVLERNDAELNFAAHKLNIFSQDHCEGRVVYWPAPVLAVVPF